MARPAFYIETHGCQMNMYDSDFITHLLLKAGYRPAVSPADADILLVNTCSVRERAERKGLARMAEMASTKAGKRGIVLGVLGCAAQRLGHTLIKPGGHINLVAGPDSYRRLPEHLERLAGGSGPIVDVRQDHAATYDLMPAACNSVTAFVSIMRGCDNFCSYCVVPHVRGRERSKPWRAIVGEVRHLVGLDVKEVTLVGQNVNSYREGGLDFTDLLGAASDIDGLERIRFTTSHPKDLTDRVIAAVRDLPKVCEHIHLPLQSGSDRILSLMNRGYTSTRYLDLVSLARREVPGVAISTDILVGFPSETAQDHSGTLRTMEAAGFESAFTFRYSVRSGTQAADLADDVPTEEKTRRLKEVIGLQNSLIDRKKAAMAGERVEILVERQSEREPDFVLGRTRKNWLAKLPRKGVRSGEVVVARVTGVSRWMLTCDKAENRIGA